MLKLKNLFNIAQLVNLLGFAAQFMAILPASLQDNKYVIVVQGIIAVLLPSLGGVGHTLAYGRKPS